MGTGLFDNKQDNKIFFYIQIQIVCDPSLWILAPVVRHGLSVATPNSGVLSTPSTTEATFPHPSVQKNWFSSRKPLFSSRKVDFYRGRATEEMDQSCIGCLKTLLLSLNLLCWVSCLITSVITQRYYKTEYEKSKSRRHYMHLWSNELPARIFWVILHSRKKKQQRKSA